VINSVTTDEAGDFVVDFSAVIDAYKGADDVKVTMLQDGLEVSTQTFTKQASTATFAVCFFSPTAKDTWKMFAVEPDIYA